jgi:hypothetical protein
MRQTGCMHRTHNIHKVLRVKSEDKHKKENAADIGIRQGVNDKTNKEKEM